MVEILRAGQCDLVVDQGRQGYEHFGVPRGGAADPAALAVANRLVGNDATAAGLELVYAGPVLRFPQGGTIAISGAYFTATRCSGTAATWNETLVLGPGEILELGAAREGCRCWLAIRGGLEVPVVMDSRSTFLPAGFGGLQGRALRHGDVLRLGEMAIAQRLLRAIPPADSNDNCLRVVAGPQAGLFDDAGLAAFFSEPYRVASASDRRGLRLNGTALSLARTELPSQGVLPGAVQVPPNGQPIILGWDGPVTGGYPVIAGVIRADWPRLAQLRPGDEVRFVTIELEAARALAEAEWEIGEQA
ncbi:MAG: biotin-dependent carboxyltransferase family protein [Thiobacillaceae bacterium]|nr:biotin-dependent carboxyltransferase family protein [Thiobacillaceae bacterium]